MKRIQVAVAERELLGRRDVRLRLVATDGSALPAFEAGAHIDLFLPNNVVRQYSLANCAADHDAYEICVRLASDSRGGSATIHADLHVGTVLEISAPRSAFALEPATRYVLIAGGIGLTPLLSMARTLSLEDGTNSTGCGDILVGADSKFDLHYYGREPDDVPYSEALHAGFANGRVFVHLSGQGDSLRHGLPKSLATPASDTLVYLCGPASMMDQLKKHLPELGWLPEQIRSEAFSARVGSSTGLSADTLAGTSSDETFEVEIRSSGRVFLVPADQTIASVLNAGGVDVSLSCEQGICGACMTGMSAGTADHRDEVQSDEEKCSNRQIAICCSRALSPRIVLDL